jgi:hypothetical protein
MRRHQWTFVFLVVAAVVGLTAITFLMLQLPSRQPPPAAGQFSGELPSAPKNAAPPPPLAPHRPPELVSPTSVKIFDDAPSLEELRKIMTPESHPSLTRSQLLQRPDHLQAFVNHPTDSVTAPEASAPPNYVSKQLPFNLNELPYNNPFSLDAGFKPFSLDHPPSSPSGAVAEIGVSQPPVPEIKSSVDEALARLQAARVAFNTPEKARVGKQFVVEAKLSTHLSGEKMKVLLEEPGKREIEALKVSDRMAATLSGGAAFDISPSGPKEQWVSSNETTDWDWQVTPKSVGAQFLILSFDARVTVNGHEDIRNINTFKRRIDVDVSWPETVGEWLEFIKTNGENVSWIWVTLLLPIGGCIWAWIRRKRRPDDPMDADMS